LVVDPVLAASSGGRLLNAAGARALRRQLLPLAKLVTPNVPEAEALTGLRIREPEEMRAAARALFEKFGCAAVVTGGHLPGKEVVEIFYDGREELLLTSPRVKGGPWRGTGCRFSAAVAAGLAKGEQLATAVATAKKFVSGEIGSSE
jgi:hydroxymethylpyrimidine/phosphomethylpyrimidine kinase